ncbi:DoxX family membrane protein [Mumia zhuanghuii]|uniref:DoxX family membrane protein n=2 Tax=Mumia TaxID=1546255 RepID=A0ABW1QLP6_9ACTN|nr:MULTISPECIES: DoxX family membrane protein [Mumia]KAA1422194.1 DoxX family membrane protein [Mumia zhuanghuii]
MAGSETNTGGAHALPSSGEIQPVVSLPVARALALLRMAIGFTFLWAFFDKTFGLTFSTPTDESWLDGVSPTDGYLSNAADGPFEGFYHAIAGQWWADWLFMLGLLGIGVSLLLGIAIRIGAACGALMYFLMWTVALPPATNPVIDDHIIGLLAVVVCGLALAGDTWGLGRTWGALDLVKANAWLR